MKKMLRNICLLAVLFLSACTTSQNGYLFGGPIFGNPDSVRVSKGDTLYSISRRYDIPLRDLIELNNIAPPYALRIGQTLKLPTNNYHIVSKGDTLYSISRKYDVDVTSLSRLNDLRPPYALAIGDKLVLPASVSSASYSSSGSATKSSTKKASTGTYRSSQRNYSRQTRAYQQQAYTPVTKKRAEKFSWPVRGTIISYYGVIGKGRKNDGINIKAPAGTSILAADKGTVVYAGNELKGFGNLILIKHPDGFITAYAHNDKIFVRKGQSIRRGQKISTVGSTGGVGTSQLHFEVHIGKKPVNPMNYLK
ncbi:MAG: M23 family metallopeptidase [Alphaproteobacteria bacterium]|nr:M23 family metallopeptidase [Alphaproteobacteria bacterium]